MSMSFLLHERLINNKINYRDILPNQCHACSFLLNPSRKHFSQYESALIGHVLLSCLTSHMPTVELIVIMQRHKLN